MSLKLLLSINVTNASLQPKAAGTSPEEKLKQDEAVRPEGGLSLA
jgi:hypothetical protein